MGVSVQGNDETRRDNVHFNYRNFNCCNCRMNFKKEKESKGKRLRRLTILAAVVGADEGYAQCDAGRNKVAETLNMGRPGPGPGWDWTVDSTRSGQLATAVSGW